MRLWALLYFANGPLKSSLCQEDLFFLFFYFISFSLYLFIYFIFFVSFFFLICFFFFFNLLICLERRGEARRGEARRRLEVEVEEKG